jgi:hypothetical protein
MTAPPRSPFSKAGAGTASWDSPVGEDGAQRPAERIDRFVYRLINSVDPEHMNHRFNPLEIVNVDWT